MKVKDSYVVRLFGVALLSIGFGSAVAETPEAAQGKLIEESILQSTDSIDAGIDYDMLEEFEITAKAKVISSDGTKLTYNADEDPAAAGKTVLEVLKGIPMVSVDAQDNIKINGKEGVKIYVNGKEEPMLSSNASQILKAMPSAAVAKIEVIHEPGAKYDAEGNAGIINLITERTQKSDGYNGSLSANFSNRNSGLTAFGMFKHNKISLSANINYINTLLQKQSVNSESTTYYKELQQTQYERGSQEAGVDYIGGSLSFAYEPNDKNLFTASANIYNVNINLDNCASESRLENLEGETLWKIEKDFSGSVKNLGLTANVGYQHNFNNPQHNLIASYQFNYGKTPFSLNHLTTELINVEQDFSRQHQHTNQYMRENTVQVDYNLPLRADNNIIGFGLKTILRDNDAFNGSEFYAEIGDLLAAESDNVSQFQNIYAGYATYNGTFFTKLNLNAGLRYEHTDMGMNFTASPEKNFSNRLNDIVPNAGITYLFGPATNLRLAYQMRISRPSLEQVNPFMLLTSPNYYRAGNPDLTSEHSNILTLTYTNFGRLFGGNIGFELFDASNMIQSYDYFDGYNIITSFANIGSKRSAALSGFINYQISNEMSVTLNGRVEYASLKAPSLKQTNHGWSGNVFAGWSWNPENIGSFSVYGGYASTVPTLQGRHSGWYFYNLSYSRTFLKNKSLKLTVFGSNFLHAKTTFTNTTITDSAEMVSKTSVSNWNVGVSLAWTFGNYQGKVKQLSTTIENDDTSKASSKSQGSI